ncbi:MAG TPA: hypothetical protein PLP64_00310 [Pseudothermotoga sp.]|nr:hypothetical protein [Pseudothermotoga sp.]HOK82660.1 hypothetical protein [Pseudothermotoga sp.]HPP70421.1 hypothetical protein [Pseudothermotoga sp.]
MKNFDVYVKKQLLEKYPSMVFFLVVMLFPHFGAKAFGLFFIMLFSLASDVRQKRLDLMTFLPLNRRQIFWMEYLFLCLLLSTTFFVGLPFAERSIYAWLVLVRSFIFFSSYFGVIISAVSIGFDPYGAAFLFLLVDLVLGGIGSSQLGPTFNPYKLISPVYQANLLASLVFALILIYMAYRLFTQRGGER